MMRTVIGTATCRDAGNPLPGTTGWNLTAGRSYRVLRCIEASDGVIWLTILDDKGAAGNYDARRFDWRRHVDGTH